MDSQKKNLNNENKNNSVQNKKDSFTQTLITSNHLENNIKTNFSMSNDDYINFFFCKNPGYLKIEKLEKSVNKSEYNNNQKKKRENSKKKIENNAFQLFKEEYKKINPNLSEQDILKNSKEHWKQMSSSFKNIYLNSENENINKSKKDN